MDKNSQNISFLQSEEWRKFQESVARKTFLVGDDNFSASLIEHELPIIGKYFYCPKWPITKITNEIQKLIKLAKENNVGWIRIDPKNEEILNSIKKNISHKIVKAPHDMQPKEIFVIDISKSEEQLLVEMKSKTRYNINLANKNGVSLRITNKSEYTNDIEEFLRLTKEMAKRNEIASHPEEYYRKMIEVLPEEMLKIYVAEYEGKIIAANLILFYKNTATYLHGASGNECRNVMAPYLLQWQAILDAKKGGYKFYDFGGISTNQELKTNNWSGITKFKLGFSPNTKPTIFPGSYDIVVNDCKYLGYKLFSAFFGFYRKLLK